MKHSVLPCNSSLTKRKKKFNLIKNKDIREAAKLFCLPSSCWRLDLDLHPSEMCEYFMSHNLDSYRV